MCSAYCLPRWLSCLARALLPARYARVACGQGGQGDRGVWVRGEGWGGRGTYAEGSTCCELALCSSPLTHSPNHGEKGGRASLRHAHPHCQKDMCSG